MWFNLPQVHQMSKICTNMKLHPVYLHFPDWQFESYFLIVSVMVLGQFCLGFVWLILQFFWGVVKFVRNTSPALVTFFFPTLPLLKNMQIALQRGGGSSNLWEIRPQHLLHLSVPPSPPLKKGLNVLQGRGGGQKPEKYVLNTCYLFLPPPNSLTFYYN